MCKLLDVFFSLSRCSRWTACLWTDRTASPPAPGKWSASTSIRTASTGPASSCAWACSSSSPSDAPQWEDSICTIDSHRPRWNEFTLVVGSIDWLIDCLTVARLVDWLIVSYLSRYFFTYFEGLSWNMHNSSQQQSPAKLPGIRVAIRAATAGWSAIPTVVE